MAVAGLRFGIIVVTTESIAGFDVQSVLGPVVGVAAHTNVPYIEGLRSLVDGSSVSETERLDVLRRSREEAIERMALHARQLGANAVVTMRFDHRQVTDRWNEICAYGTAVHAVPVGVAAGAEGGQVSSVETVRL
jgi:uncharacterized protein YbjQ (UPF0145 family)